MSLQRTTTVDVLADALRTRILDGDPPGGSPLREQHLSTEYDVARHTLRAALRQLAAEGIVRIEPHRGARVSALDKADVAALGELRIALETEAARLALSAHGGALPDPVHAAQDDLERACAHPDGHFSGVAAAHEALHHAIVAASGSPRIVAAHRALGGEIRLFLVQLRPAWDVATIGPSHARLLADLERNGPEVLRGHIEESTRALLAY